MAAPPSFSEGYPGDLTRIRLERALKDVQHLRENYKRPALRTIPVLIQDLDVLAEIVERILWIHVNND